MSRAVEVVHTDFFNRIGGNALLTNLEADLPDVASHCERVGRATVGLLQHAGFEEEEIAIAYAGAVLHDIGKVHPRIRGLIHLPRGFNSTEREVVGWHPSIGQGMVTQLESSHLVGRNVLLPAAIGGVIGMHHFDVNQLSPGSNWYHGVIAGEQMADVTDAVTDPTRPYREPASQEELEEILHRDFKSIGRVGKLPIKDAINYMVESSTASIAA